MQAKDTTNKILSTTHIVIIRIKTIKNIVSTVPATTNCTQASPKKWGKETGNAHTLSYIENENMFLHFLNYKIVFIRFDSCGFHTMALYYYKRENKKCENIMYMYIYYIIVSR